MKRLKINVQGQVQGVGFRPHTYRIATELALTGYVNNNASGVQIEIQGKFVDAFLKRLQDELPILAKIDTLSYSSIPIVQNEKAFTIKKSEFGNVTAKISPDATICKNCLTELFDPNSQYYLYPFINCTHCGPRYTITGKLPYDRAMTSMCSFKMCDCCQKAYENPLDRRYHAQPIACEKCGPELSLSITEIVKNILAGKIIALKGLGGYQIICDAKNKAAIKRLRKNKNRPGKPFAVMALNLMSAKKIVDCTFEAEKLLMCQERPIVVLPKNNTELPDEIAPQLNSLGVMLPYTPIHYLLFHELLGQPANSNWINEHCDFILLVTSANHAGSPLITEDNEAIEKLSSIVDLIVSYDRDILVRVDDSVMTLIDNKPAFIRRARSFVPQPIALPYEIPPTLALGAYLKNTICITRGSEAFVSQHIGNLNHRETIRFYRESLAHLLKILNVKPEAVAHDYHPDFYSTQIAYEFNCPAFSIQHHHAHLAACAAEQSILSDALGIVLDGFGLGENNENWGGELMYYSNVHSQRLGSLKPIAYVGGDVVIKEPWRMAASILHALKRTNEIKTRFSKYSQARHLEQLLENNNQFPRSSSCGRLFDAASALLGICEIASYEAEAPMLLESKVTKPSFLNSGWSIESNQLNLLPLFEAISVLNSEEGANLFHGTLASALVEWIAINAKKNNLSQVILSGGCFSNKVLTELVINQLKALGLMPVYPRLLPVNDGGISLGQAWIAGHQLMEQNKCV